MILNYFEVLGIFFWVNSMSSPFQMSCMMGTRHFWDLSCHVHRFDPNNSISQPSGAAVEHRGFHVDVPSE